MKSEAKPKNNQLFSIIENTILGLFDFISRYFRTLYKIVFIPTQKVHLWIDITKPATFFTISAFVGSTVNDSFYQIVWFGESVDISEEISLIKVIVKTIPFILYIWLTALLFSKLFYKKRSVFFIDLVFYVAGIQILLFWTGSFLENLYQNDLLFIGYEIDREGYDIRTIIEDIVSLLWYLLIITIPIRFLFFNLSDNHWIKRRKLKRFFVSTFIALFIFSSPLIIYLISIPFYSEKPEKKEYELNVTTYTIDYKINKKKITFNAFLKNTSNEELYLVKSKIILDYVRLDQIVSSDSIDWKYNLEAIDTSQIKFKITNWEGSNTPVLRLEKLKNKIISFELDNSIIYEKIKKLKNDTVRFKKCDLNLGFTAVVFDKSYEEHVERIYIGTEELME